jgi:group II intron reverse transcriptase/maturase
MEKLDEKFRQLLTEDNVRSAFEKLKRDKYDMMKNKIKIAVGCDGIGHEKFEEKLLQNSLYICGKGKKGTYQFRPFKEIETPKPPYGKGKEELEKARKDGNKIRILSISTIRDTIFQKLLVNIVSKHAEISFAEHIDLNSYGYRDGKSSKDAVKKIRRYIDKGYVYALDGDIKKFFDEINHNLLIKKMEKFFGADNKLVQRYLRRFIRVKKITKGKNTAEERKVGIPQGGVLSGLLANVFLFDFDLFVVNTMMKEYEFQYIRYADDFVLLFKVNEKLDEVFERLAEFLAKEGLTLHPLPPDTPDPKAKYSKKLDLSKEGKGTLDFLGFEISEKFLRIKNDNIKKFKKRIVKTLKDIKTNISSEDSHNAYFYQVVTKINKKITALEDVIEQENGLCLACKKLIPKRSWIGYFMMTTDVRQLRNIDTMIRAEIFRDYRRRTYGHHLDKKEVLARTSGIKFVTDAYYEYRSQERKYKREHGKIEYCQNKNRYYDPISEKILTPVQGVLSCSNDDGFVG